MFKTVAAVLLLGSVLGWGVLAATLQAPDGMVVLWDHPYGGVSPFVVDERTHNSVADGELREALRRRAMEEQQSVALLPPPERP